VGRFLCRIGVHEWRQKRNPDGPNGATWYLECERCLKQRLGLGGGGGGGGGGNGGYGGNGGNGGNGG
jgi:hypothetical protein